MESKAIPGERNSSKRVQRQETETCDSCSGNGEESIWLKHRLVGQIGGVKQEQ